MNTELRYEKPGRVARWSVLYACLMFAAAGHAGESRAQPYVLNAIADVDGGTEILDGDYDAAIDRISIDSNKIVDRVLAATNLCVAYTKAGEVTQATTFCDTAVAELETAITKGRSLRKQGYYRTDLRRFQAIALSNRGVLRAITGDTEAARNDFDAALALKTRVAAIRSNLLSLNERSASAA